MKRNFLIALLMIIALSFYANSLLAQKQITIVMEDGKSITSSNFSIKPGSITVDGVNYSKKDILFVKDNGKMKVMNFVKGKLLSLKKRYKLDPSNQSDLGKIYAVKYYNTYPSKISSFYNELSENSDFMQSYNDFVKKIKTGNALSAVGVVLSLGVLVAVFFVI
jgi:hypothetical protein